MKSTDPESGPRSPGAGRFLFALLAVLLAIAAFASLATLASREGARHARASSAAREIARLGGRVSWNPEVYETLLRDKALTRITDVHFDNPQFADEEWLVLNELPQRFGLQVRGSQFTNASLQYLKQVPRLDYLVLKDTSVTDQGVADLKKALPRLRIMFGYPGDPSYREIR